MILLAYNIGYRSGVLNGEPLVSAFDSVSELIKDLRSVEAINYFFDWAEAAAVTPSTMRLFLTIIDVGSEEYSGYTINLMNVREYRKAWENKYDSEWTKEKERDKWLPLNKTK